MVFVVDRVLRQQIHYMEKICTFPLEVKTQVGIWGTVGEAPGRWQRQGVPVKERNFTLLTIGLNGLPRDGLQQD